MIDYFGITDVGLVRKENQDSYYTGTNKDGDFLAIVCDGIGGALAGDVASGETVKYFEEHFKESGNFTNLEEIKSFIINSINSVNSKVYELSNKHAEFSGMGTTITGILISKYGTLSINAGDSRTYGFLDNKIFHLTKDHTLVNMMLERGEITYEESLNHPKKHYLVRALGVWDYVEVDVHEVKDMNKYLICSDGLCGYVEDDEILNIINQNTPSEEACKKLMEVALLKGGYDNVTIIVVNINNENS